MILAARQTQPELDEALLKSFTLFSLRRRVRSGHNRTSHRKAMALILRARFFLSNQRHCRWLAAIENTSSSTSKTATTERVTASDASYPLCPLLPFQTANALLVCSLEPGGFRFPPDPRRNQSSRNESLRSKASYSDALFLLLRCRPQAGSASQKPLWFSWIFPALPDRLRRIRTA